MFPAGLVELREAVVAAGRAVDPDTLALDQAVVVLRELTLIANAASAAGALVAARIDTTGPPPSVGASDTADFIAKSTGTTATAARRRIKTGTRLRDAPKTRARALDGSLSPDQTDAVADAVAVDPSLEDGLLDIAQRSSLGELRDECARRKAAADPNPDATRRRIHRNRRLRRYRDAEGAEHLHAVGTRDQMARLDVALRAEIDKVFKAARTAGVREPLEAYAFDALVALADRDDTTAAPKPRHLAILRVDLEALVRGSIEGDETCEIGGLGPIPVSVARDLLGDSILKLVITRGVDVRNVTHLGRGATIAQRIALLWERPICAREGCGRRARLEIDHREDWSQIHKTEVVNLEPMCHHDHWLKTTKGWALVDGQGVRPMVPPDDPRHPHHQHTQVNAA